MQPNFRPIIALAAAMSLAACVSTAVTDESEENGRAPFAST